MDMTTVAPPISAWDLIAELAAHGNTSANLSDVRNLADSIVERVCVHLQCPWAVMVLHSVEEPIVAAQSIPASSQAFVNHDLCDIPLPNLELQLSIDQVPAGTLWIGTTPQLEAALPPRFGDALRGQIELLIALQRRESTRLSSQNETARELFVIHENGKIIASGLNFEAMLARVAENIALALRVDRCVIHVRDQAEPSVLIELASYSADESAEIAFPRYTVSGRSPIAELIDSGIAQVLGSEQAAHQGVLGFQSALLLPLKARDQIIGLLGVGFAGQEHSFIRSDINLAQTLTDQVAAAVAGAQAYEAEQRRARELDALQELNQRLGGEQPLNDTLHAVLRGIRGFIPFSGAQISLFNPDEQRLSTALRLGLLGESTRRSDDQRGQPLSRGLAGWLGRYRRSLRLATFQRPPVKSSPIWLANGTASVSYLGMPLLVSEQLVGTIELYGDRAGAFSAEHERLLQLVASQVAQAIVNARHFARTDAHLRSRLQQLTALQRISRQLTATLSLDLIFRFALEEALQATTATQAWIALRSGDGEGLHITDADNGALIAVAALNDDSLNPDYTVIAVAGYGVDVATLVGQQLQLEGTTAGGALMSGEPRLVDELEIDDRLNHSGPDVAAALAMPVYYENQIVGVVNLHSDRAHAFDHDTVEFVRALTDQVALALGNAQRYEEQQRQRTLLQQRAGMLKQVLDIGQALRADRSLEEVLEQIAFSIIDTAGFRRAVFNVADPDSPEIIRVKTGAGLALTELERMREAPWPKGFVDLILDPQFRLGRCFFVPAERTPEIHEGFDLAPIVSNLDVTSDGPNAWQAQDSLFVPLYSTDARLLGVLSVDEPYNRQRPTARSLEALEVLADQAAIAIENSNLLREARAQTEQMRALYQVGAASVSTLSLDELLQRVYTEIVAYMGTPSFFFVAAFDDQRQTVKFELFKGNDQTLGTHTKRIEPKGGLTGWVIDTGEVLYIRDYSVERKRLPVKAVVLQEGLRSWVGIPLRSQNKVIGVLSVQSFEPNAFAERHIRFLSSLANQLAIALENARLFEERERRIAELDVINDVGRITSTTLDLSVMFSQTYERLHAFLQMDAGYIYAYNELRHEVELSLEADDGVRNTDTRARIPTPGSLTEHILQTRQPLMFQDLAKERTPSDLQPVTFGHAERRSAAWLGVPLLANDGEIVGVLSVQSYTPNLYGEREVAFLTALASQLALGVQNVRLFTRTQEQVRQLGLLNRASLVASSTLDLDIIYQTIVTTMADVMDSTQARLMLFDHASGTVSVASELNKSRYGNQRFEMAGQTWVDWLLQHRRPLTSFDTLADPRFTILHGVLRHLDVRSAVVFPLIVGDVVIGAIGVDSTGRQRVFSLQDIDLCQTIANQASTAIEKARLFEEIERNADALGSKVGELSTLLEAARVLSSSLRPDEVLNRLMDVVGRHLNVNTVGLWKIGADTMLRPAALLGISQDVAATMVVPVGEGMTGRVAATGEPLIVTNVEVHGSSLYPDFNREHRLTSFMGVPVVYREQIIGVLSVMTVQPRQFSADEQMLLAGMADQAAIALENARLFAERDRRIAELTSFNRISQRLNATLELQELLVALHEEIGQVLDHACSFIALYDPATQQISYPIFWEDGQPVRQGKAADIATEPSVSRRVITERHPVLLGTRNEVVHYLNESGLSEPQMPTIASWLSVPIVEGDDVFGILNVRSGEANQYDSDDERFLITVAGLAATAIARAKLFSERERRLREVSVLQDISSAITSTLNLQDVLERLHTQLGRVVDVSTSFIGLYDPATELLSFQIAFDHGVPTDFPPVEMQRSGMNAWVITNRQPLLIGTDEQAWQYRDNPSIIRVGPDDLLEQSYLVVPIISGDHVLGVINIQSYGTHAFNDDDLRFVSAVASQAAVAIDNARLFQERGRRIEELSTFNDIGRQFSSVPKLDDLLDLIYRQTSRLLDTTNFYIGLYDEYTDVVTFPMYYHAGELVSQAPLTSPNSLSHAVIRDRAPFLLQGPGQAERLEQLGIVPVGPLSKSWLGVPMVANDQVIGVIGIQDYERENAYSQEDVRLLSTLASWSAVALANARMFTDQRQSLQELSVLYDMSVQLAGTLVATEIQRIVVINALELLNVQVGALLLFDERRHVTQQFVFDHENPDQTDYPLASADSGLLELLFERDKPLVQRDVSVIEESTLAHEYGLRGLIGEVIGPRDQPLGVLWLGDRQPRDWQSRELSLLSIIATLSGQGLKSAHLFEREQGRRVVADTLRDVAERLTGVLEQDEIFALILDQLGRVVAYDSASLMLRDADENMMRIVATRGFPEQQGEALQQVRFNLNDDADLRTITRTKRPLVLFDAQTSHDFVSIEDSSNIRGWIGAPLLLGDQVIGLLTVDSRQPGAYDEEDAQTAFTLASQAAQAIRNARLFEEVRRFTSELEQRVEERTAALAELNMQLADEKQRLQAVHAITVELTASLELRETLSKTLQLAAKNLSVRRGSIMLWDEKERRLVCRAVLGDNGEVYAEQIPITFQSGTGLAGWVREHQQPLCIGDVRKDRRWVQESGRAHDVRSVVAVPLRAEGVGTLGVLMLTSPHLNYFSPAQEQLLSTIANEVAIVIHNAELYSLVQEFATKLSESLNQQKEETVKNQAILRSLGEGVLVLDDFERVILFNPAAEAILGMSEARMIGQKLSDIVTHVETPAARDRAQIVYDTLNTGLRSLDGQSKSHQLRLELTNPAQSIELAFTSVVGTDTTLYGSVVVLRDVTREIEADRAKRDFISSVSHELRTPLTAIKGYVDLLVLGAAGPVNEGQQSFLGVVKNNANRLMDLINDILEIGRIDANKIQLNFEPLDLRLIFNDVLQTMRAEMDRKKMQVALHMADDLPLVEADERRLTQVILNLVSNAVKYTFTEGQIEIRASLNRAGLVQVDVADNGVGISPEQQQYLFRRFYRADNPLRDEAGGTGLGLSIAKSFVELHGGEMWVKSETGEGSTFSFVLPVTQPEQPEIEP